MILKSMNSFFKIEENPYLEQREIIVGIVGDAQPFDLFQNKCRRYIVGSIVGIVGI